MNMTPQQQLELYAMLEQQSRLMAQMLNPQQQMPMGWTGQRLSSTATTWKITL